MKATNILMLAAAGYVVYYLGNLGVATNTVNFVFQGVTVNSIKDFIINLTVQNVSNANINLNSLAGDIYLNGQPFANISDFTKRVIAANSQTNIQIHVAPNLSSIPATLFEAMTSKDKALNFHITGNANVNSLVLPFVLDKNISA